MVRVEPLFPTTRGSHFHEISPTITFRGFVRSYIFVPPFRRKCIPPRCGSAMVLPIPQDGFGPLDFSSDILREFNFGTEFDFGREFSFDCTHSEVTQKRGGKGYLCICAFANATLQQNHADKKMQKTPSD